MEHSTQIGIESIKSKFILNKIFSYIHDKKKLYIIKPNKNLQAKLEINLKTYENWEGKTKIYNEDLKLIFEGEYSHHEKNGKGKEYDREGNLIFEGEYFNGRRWNGWGYKNLGREKSYQLIKGNGYVKEYEGFTLIYEGEYTNGEKNGKGTEYFGNNKIKFVGEYKNGKIWSGKGYNYDGRLTFEVKDGNGMIKEYRTYGDLLFESEYLNGEKTGKAKEYKYYYDKEWIIETGDYSISSYYYLAFDGNYLNGRRHGKGKEYDNLGFILFEGEYLNGQKNGFGKEYDEYEHRLIFEGVYSNNKKINGKEYNRKVDLEFEGEFLDNKRWNGKIKEYDYCKKLVIEGELLKGKKWKRQRIFL